MAKGRVISKLQVAISQLGNAVVACAEPRCFVANAPRAQHSVLCMSRAQLKSVFSSPNLKARTGVLPDGQMSSKLIMRMAEDRR
jgi:hypothetical protein